MQKKCFERYEDNELRFKKENSMVYLAMVSIRNERFAVFCQSGWDSWKRQKLVHYGPRHIKEPSRDKILGG